MELDLAAAGRALEFIGLVANNLVTLHADFVLGFIIGVAGLRRLRRGGWADLGYLSFLGGLTLVLFLGIAFLGLRLAIPEWPLFFAGAAAAGLAWITSGALPISVRRVARRTLGAAVHGLSYAAFRARRPRIPDQLPRELRSIDARHG